jgi:hypothetical protein
VQSLYLSLCALTPLSAFRDLHDYFVPQLDEEAFVDAVYFFERWARKHVQDSDGMRSEELAELSDTLAANKAAVPWYFRGRLEPGRLELKENTKATENPSRRVSVRQWADTSFHNESNVQSHESTQPCHNHQQPGCNRLQVGHDSTHHGTKRPAMMVKRRIRKPPAAVDTASTP